MLVSSITGGTVVTQAGAWAVATSGEDRRGCPSDLFTATGPPSQFCINASTTIKGGTKHG